MPRGHSRSRTKPVYVPVQKPKPFTSVTKKRKEEYAPTSSGPSNWAALVDKDEAQQDISNDTIHVNISADRNNFVDFDKDLSLHSGSEHNDIDNDDAGHDDNHGKNDSGSDDIDNDDTHELVNCAGDLPVNNATIEDNSPDNTHTDHDDVRPSSMSPSILARPLLLNICL
ncbi:hypothetical protein PanWU01x14_026380 [Parasponia andersonii]|uniref:Uncharacterized protein n=1 Tax=Parasponia andersonii TaxID=3476 RepID=A0A2P5DW08_PARAD|nr:hypothetical protein PanWU01x14_026380 [Parasponia andersonii]